MARRRDVANVVAIARMYRPAVVHGGGLRLRLRALRRVGGDAGPGCGRNRVVLGTFYLHRNDLLMYPLSPRMGKPADTGQLFFAR